LIYLAISSRFLLLLGQQYFYIVLIECFFVFFSHLYSTYFAVSIVLSKALDRLFTLGNASSRTSDNAFDYAWRWRA